MHSFAPWISIGISLAIGVVACITWYWREWRRLWPAEPPETAEERAAAAARSDRWREIANLPHFRLEVLRGHRAGRRF